VKGKGGRRIGRQEGVGIRFPLGVYAASGQPANSKQADHIRLPATREGGCPWARPAAGARGFRYGYGHSPSNPSRFLGETKKPQQAASL